MEDAREVHNIYKQSSSKWNEKAEQKKFSVFVF